MQTISPEAFRTQPWKNGGGITHEIARADRDGTLLWRLSIAEVASDGPFSAFPGLTRILTVIEGAGLHLETPEGRIDALPLRPVAFSGDLPVDSRMIAGPIRDFNLIFDATRLAAEVRCPASRTDCIQGAGRFYACLALGAGLAVDGVAIPAGGAAIYAAGTLTGPDGTPTLLARVDPI